MGKMTEILKKIGVDEIFYPDPLTRTHPFAKGFRIDYKNKKRIYTVLVDAYNNGRTVNVEVFSSIEIEDELKQRVVNAVKEVLQGGKYYIYYENEKRKFGIEACHPGPKVPFIEYLIEYVKEGPRRARSFDAIGEGWSIAGGNIKEINQFLSDIKTEDGEKKIKRKLLERGIEMKKVSWRYFEGWAFKDKSVCCFEHRQEKCECPCCKK